MASADTLTKTSTEATTQFVETYYPALEKDRSSLSSFYVASATMPDGKALPNIVFNGNVIADTAAFQTLFEKQMPKAHYEVQSFDCHVLNPSYPVPAEVAAGSTAADNAKNMSILVSTSGYVKFGETPDAKMRGFSESVVLVPNFEPAKTGRPQARPRRDWLIQSQNFRLVV